MNIKEAAMKDIIANQHNSDMFWFVTEEDMEGLVDNGLVDVSLINKWWAVNTSQDNEAWSTEEMIEAVDTVIEGL